MSAISKGDLISLIRKHRRAYEDGTPTIGDEEYDALIKIYEDRYGDYDDRGLLPKGKTIKLPYYMGSMEKIKAPDVDNQIAKWIDDYHGPYLIMDKVNGISILYTDGKLYTKGNHDRGKNVTHLLKYLDLPELEDNEVVRGELVIPTQVFDDYVEKNEGKSNNALTSALSMIAGIVNNLKKSTIPLLKQSEFIAYRYAETDKEEYNPTTQLEILKELGFLTPTHIEVDEINGEMLDRTLDKFRKKAPYDIDGIVVIDNNPHIYPTNSDPEHMIAYKRDTCYITKVIDVTWKGQASGRMVPIVQIEPVVASGATITNVSGYNALYIENNKIGPGAVVSVCRSGEIIPKINHVIIPSDNVSYPEEDVEWDGPNLVLVNPEDHADYHVSKMVRFVKDLGINNIRADRIKALYDIGVRTIDDLIKITPEEMVEANLFSTKLATSLYEELHTALRESPIDVIMSASYIFGKGFHSKRFRKILEVIPDIISLDDETLRNYLLQIPGIGVKIMEAFLANREKFINWIKAYPEIYEKFVKFGKEEEPEEEKKEDIEYLKDIKTIVFTGFRNKELEKFLQNMGINVRTSVSKKTDLVVVGDGAKPSSKLKKAQDLGLEIVTLSKFKELIET